MGRILGRLSTALALLAIGAAFPPEREAPAPDRAERARAAFARFQALAGTWTGESTKGWSEDLTFRVIAGGSAVLETAFDAHPGETMVTLFTLNGQDLDLTHYCVAKNQPHLRATAIGEDARQVTFTFVDGGNLPSRDTGHMDKAVFRFEDADHVTTQWTWYANGKESWMEEIRLVRRR